VADQNAETGACRTPPSDAPHSSDLSNEVELLQDPDGRVSPAPADGSAPRVLVVTASEELTGYVCQGLARVWPPVRGFEESHQERVVERVDQLRPVLLVLDADLGDEGGFGLCEAVRAAYGHHPLVLMLIDGARRHEAERRSAAAGADGHLSKPFNLSRVAAEVARLIATYADTPTQAEPP